MILVRRRRLVIFGLYAILALVLCSCSLTPPKSRKASADWSRGVYLGQFAIGSIGVAATEDSSRIHITWPYEAQGEEGLYYVQLNSSGEPVATFKLRLSSGRPLAPRLLMANEGRVHLLWASRAPGQDGASLWHILLDSDGTFGGTAYQLMGKGATAGGYDAASDDSGGAFVVWEANDGSGVYGIQIDGSGAIHSQPILVTTSGESPAVRVDAAGVRHLAWRIGADFFYGQLPPGDPGPAQGFAVARVPTGTGISLVGPMMGLSDGWAYLFWSIRNQSGLEAGTARTQFTAFPSDTPRNSVPTTIWMYRSEAQPYQEYQGTYPLTQLVKPSPSRYSADFVYQPAPIQGENKGLAVAIAMSQELHQDVQAQISLAMFEAGEFQGYQMASKTDALSQQATLTADAAGHLHLAWREGATGNRVYYATTAPSARPIMDRLDEQDLIQALLQGGVEGLSGLAMFPFALMWMVPGLALLGVLELTWSQEKQSKEVAQALLGTAIILFLTAKSLLFPAIFTYVPFSAWLDIPGGWSLSLRISVPLVILGIALLFGRWVRKRHSPSNVLYYCVVAVTDATLTLIIYGVNFWGTT